MRDHNYGYQPLVEGATYAPEFLAARINFLKRRISFLINFYGLRSGMRFYLAMNEEDKKMLRPTVKRLVTIHISGIRNVKEVIRQKAQSASVS